MNEEGSITITPARGIAGSLTLPGDKSISHRYAMLAGVAEGRCTFQNFSTGADCASTLACLRALGCSIEHNGTTVTIDGRAGAFSPPAQALDCGNSGSTIRMLSGLLAAQPFTSELVGDASLS